MKRLISFVVLLLLSSLSLSPAYGLKVPESSEYDPRVRRITYNPQDVTQLETVVGIATHIVVEEGEQYVTHAFGDAEAWNFANELNHYFIKPKEENADTNLIIVTDRRVYYFRLSYHPTRNALAMYGVKFSYPDSDLKIAQKSAIEQGFSRGAAEYNLSYTMSGDTDIAPVNAWDNNEFTYFKFPGNRDIPGIYMVDAEGNESIVNRHTMGHANDIIAVHKVNQKWILRLGNRALAVYNDAYDPKGITNVSGTATSAVKRVIKGSN